MPDKKLKTKIEIPGIDKGTQEKKDAQKVKEEKAEKVKKGEVITPPESLAHPNIMRRQRRLILGDK